MKFSFSQNVKRHALFTIAAVMLLCRFSPLAAQEVTKVMGTVKDAKTGEPIPFVNVYFKGATIGATTGFEGQYSLETRKPIDTLIASYVGYGIVRKGIQVNHFQVVDFQLSPENYELSEVVITPGENPAEVLLRKVIAHKDQNDPDKVANYQCEVYTKMQFDANNISEKFKNRKVLEPFRFIFEHMDTSTVNGKAYLPILLSESFSDIYFRRTPRARKEFIKASQISGVNNPTMSQFAGNLAQDVNIYDNFINLFQKNFPSPISSFGLLYYRYYLIDSTSIDGKWCYNVMFKPRRKQEYAFTGNFWVNDTSFALKKVEMRMVSDANVNFINDLVVSEEFEMVDNIRWMLKKELVVADFNVVQDAKVTMGFFGTRTVIFNKYDFKPVRDEKIYGTPNDIIVKDDAVRRDKDFWNHARPEALSYREASVYRLADTLLKMPLFNTYRDIAQMAFTGYYVRNKFEWGPYSSTYSFDATEGNRFRVGGRTSNKFSTKTMFEGYVAYGTKDQAFKYRLGLVYFTGKLPDRKFSASYSYDMEQLGSGEESFRQDFIFNSLFRRNPQNKLSNVGQFTWAYKHEWFTGFSNTLTFTNRKIYTISNEGIKLYDPYLGDYTLHKQITTSEIQLDLHYGYHEKVIAGEFERSIVNSHYPVFDFQYAYGIPNLLNGEFEYHRARARVSQWFNWSSAGWSKYVVEGGKTWGQLPYPLMKIHSGNETFYYDESAFNLMNYYEFVSDEYLSFLFTHHFDGFFLNRIPAIRKLKWREVAQIRGVVGHTSQQNLDYNSFPSGTYSLSKPYFETGVGIENIFRFIRVDGFWRLSYNDHPNTSPFGVLVSVNFDF